MPVEDAKCAECGDMRASHVTPVELDSLYPAKAPHRYGHCRACCDPEGDDYTGCEHGFVEPTQQGDATAEITDLLNSSTAQAHTPTQPDAEPA